MSSSSALLSSLLSLLLLLLLLLAFIASSASATTVATSPSDKAKANKAVSDKDKVDDDDDLYCAVCVILLGLITQSAASSSASDSSVTIRVPSRASLQETLPLASWSSSSSSSSLEAYCEMLPDRRYRGICHRFLPLLTPGSNAYLTYMHSVEQKWGPEDTCAALGVCTRPECRLWDVDASKPARPVPMIAIAEEDIRLRGNVFGNYDDEQCPIDVLVRDWQRGNLLEHMPPIDRDNDLHSELCTLRGGSWRGRDCNDEDATIHPGRMQSSHDASVDHNCNGIYGENAQGVSYEELYCSNTTQKGVIILGDSISAHFHIPAPSVTPNISLWDALLMGLNEVDYPQCSWGTGFVDDLELCSESSHLNRVNSVYKQLRERNLCMHRDYQDISRNGARCTSLFRDLVPTISRSQDDQPALVIYAMIANDVCGGSNSDFPTYPDEYYEYVSYSLDYLDDILAPGSSVVLLGHMGGELIWDSMHDQMHYIGTTYGDLFDYLACLEVSPCSMWLNKDPEVRASATAHAESLDAQLKYIADNHRYVNFNVVYLDHPDIRYVPEYEASGRNPAELYTVVDGGHPSVIGETLMAEYIFADLLEQFPEIVGDVNPFNDDIRAQFGDQGGY